MFARIHRTIWLKCFILVSIIWVQSPYNIQHYDLCLCKTNGEQWWVAFFRGQYWDWCCLTSLSAPWTVSLSAPSANCSDKARRNGFKVKEGVFGVAIRKKLKKDLKLLPREAVKIPSMEAFKAKLVEVPVHGRGYRTKGSLRFLPIKIILQFCGSKKSISEAFVPSLHRQVHLPLSSPFPCSTTWFCFINVTSENSRVQKTTAVYTRSFHCSALEHRYTNSWTRGQQPAVSQKAVMGTSHYKLAFRVILMKNCTLESNFVELPWALL